MAEIIGITGICFVALLTFFTALNKQRIANVLFLGLALRIFVILMGHFVVTLPDSGGDAEAFEIQAWLWAQNGFFEALGHFPGPDSSFISWIISILYSLTGRSILLAQSVSLLFGMTTILIGWLVTKQLFGDRAAMKAAYVLACFPTLILYSSLTLREAYTWCFLLLAIYGVIGWVRSGRLKSVLLAIIGFTGATFFHGAMAIGGIIFLIIVFCKSIKVVLANLILVKLNLRNFILVIFSGIFFTLFFNDKISFDKIGTLNKAINFESIHDRMVNSTRKRASYPEWTVPNDYVEMIYKVPIRVVYFMFSPFPWNIKIKEHVIGFIDGLLYLALSILIWKNRREIWEDPASKIILIILLSYIFVFGLMIGNFGTGIRHRAKFVAIIIILASSKIPRLVFKNISKD